MGKLTRRLKRFWNKWGWALPGGLPLWAWHQAARRVMNVFQTPKINRGDDRSQAYDWSGIHTDYGQGLIVPVVLGQVRVGGACIYQSVRATGDTEYLTIGLALSEGRIHGVGGVTGGDIGEADNLGGITFGDGGTPNGLRINGVTIDHTLQAPGVLCSLRMGEGSQSALPSGGAPTAVQDVNADLKDNGTAVTATISGSDDVIAFDFILTAPSGCYQTSGTGSVSPAPVDLDFDYRPSGSTTWTSLRGTYRFGNLAQGRLGQFTEVLRVTLPAGVNLPLEFRVTRRTAAVPGDRGSNLVTWRQLGYQFAAVLRYPGVAIMELYFPATDRFSGTRPDITVPVQGIKVRVYDTTLGLSTKRYWTVPAVGDTYNGIWTYDPGRNPAWLALEFLTNTRWGLGAYVTTADLDLENVRDWADYCDDTVNSAARYTCDVVLDAPRSAWEVLQAICEAGRAIPYVDGNKIRFHYHCKDAHGRGANSVAARSSVAVLTSADIEDMQITYLDRTQRPNVLEVQFLDEAKDYEQSTVTVEDDSDSLNQPYKLDATEMRKESVALLATTRASQAMRHGHWMHRVNRLIESEVAFTCGPRALALTIGDRFSLEHDYLRPYDRTPRAVRITTATGSVSTVHLDHEVTLEAAVTYKMLFDDGAGTIAERTVTSGAGTYAAGAAITLNASVSVRKGMAIVLGESAKLVRDYQVSAISLADDLRRQVQAIEWHDALHVEPSAGDMGDDTIPDFLPAPAVEGSTDYGTIQSITATPTYTPGMVQVSWPAAISATSGVRALGRRARLYALTDEGTTLLGESDNGTLTTALLAPGNTYSLAVTWQEYNGSFRPVGEDDFLSVTVDEFVNLLPPPIVGLTAHQSGRQVVLEWQPADARTLDYYEVRRGSGWVGSEVVYRGSAPRYIEERPTYGTLNYYVAARSIGGLYSAGKTTAAQALTELPDRTALATVDELVSTPTGTLTNLTYDSSAKTLRISDGKLYGTYVTVNDDTDLEAGVAAGLFHWHYTADFRQVDTETVGDWTFTIGSAEAKWRTLYARDSSPTHPGADWSQQIGSLPPTIGEWSSFLVSGNYGITGSRTRWRITRGYDPPVAANDFDQGLPAEFAYGRRQALTVEMWRLDTNTNLYLTQLKRAVYDP